MVLKLKIETVNRKDFLKEKNPPSYKISLRTPFSRINIDEFAL